MPFLYVTTLDGPSSVGGSVKFVGLATAEHQSVTNKLVTFLLQRVRVQLLPGEAMWRLVDGMPEDRAADLRTRSFAHAAAVRAIVT